MRSSSPAEMSMPSWCNCSRSKGWVTCWWWYWWRMRQIRSGPKWLPGRTAAGGGATKLCPSGGSQRSRREGVTRGRGGRVLAAEAFLPLKDRLGRDVGQGDNDLIGDRQLRGLGSLGGAGAFGLRVARRPGWPLQRAGGDPGSGLEALEVGDLVLELVDALFESLDPLLLVGD